MKHIKHKIVILMMVFISPVMFHATSFKLVSDVGTSAEMIGKGNLEGFSKGAHAIFENPSSLSQSPSLSGSFFTTTFFDDSVFHSFAASSEFWKGHIGVGYSSLGITDVPRTVINQTTDQFEVASNFNYKNSIYKVGLELPLTELLNPDHKQLKDVSVGLAALHYRHDIGQYKGDGTDMEFGFFYEGDPVLLSLTFRNLLSNEIRYNHNKTERIPLQTILSGKKGWNDVDLFVQYKHTLGHNLFSMGSTYTLPFARYLNLSLGYKSILVIDKKKTNMTLGLGLDLKGIQFNYAYESSDHVLYNSKHYFSLSLFKATL